MAKDNSWIITIRVSEELNEKLEEYQKIYECSKSEATRKLIESGILLTGKNELTKEITIQGARDEVCYRHHRNYLYLNIFTSWSNHPRPLRGTDYPGWGECCFLWRHSACLTGDLC